MLQAENKMLRQNLKRMSGNVDVLIQKMRQVSLKKGKGAFQPEDLLMDDSQMESASTVASNLAGSKRGAVKP